MLRAKTLLFADWKNQGTLLEPVHCVLPTSGLRMIRNAFRGEDAPDRHLGAAWID